MSGGWIHSFAVTDTQTHKNGYTIYKITSIVFPRSIPQALTSISVWKRFHDIKRLHRELNRRLKNAKIPARLPEPTDSSYFKRFDAEVIERRKEYILQLLYCVAQYPILYKCHVFFQFFSVDTNESPLHKLHVERSHHVLTNVNIVDECGQSSKKTDEICNSIVVEKLQQVAVDNEKEKSTATTTAEVVVFSECEKPRKDYARFLTPMASVESEDSDYIYEAALEFSHAVQAEANLEYNEAHMRYKRGVEVLLNGSKGDGNEERKFIAKTKIAKYLARADDIYEKFLCGDNDANDAFNNSGNKLSVQLSLDVTDNESCNTNSTIFFIERPLNQLAKYKVLKILGQRVMCVQCVTEPQRPIYVIKGIEKPSRNAPTQTIFLPQHVPYMVDLLAFFQSEQKIYLLLRHAEGGRLWDYVQSYTPAADKCKSVASIFPSISNDTASDDSHDNAQDSGYGPTECSEASELVRCSQQLLESVTDTLNKVKALEEEKSKVQEIKPDLENNFNKLPEASVKQWSRELFVAIESLHEKGVILADLHMNNLLLGSKGQLLLTYFYQNQSTSEDAHSFYAHSAHCIAPERPLNFKSDWWSYGVILYQFLLGLPFKAMHPGNIDLYGYVQYPDDVELSACARDLLNNLLKQLPEERYDAEEIRVHEFFKGTNWVEVRQNGLNNFNNIP